jgi:hypothetical protein
MTSSMYLAWTYFDGDKHLPPLRLLFLTIKGVKMINGIDLLFVVMGVILLLLVVEIWDRYRDWFDWDRDRRRQRKQESLAEAQYRGEISG